jgi:hypothetical protein
MALKEEYAQNYWQLGNLITGFAVAEVLATLFAIGNAPVFARGIWEWRNVVVWSTAAAHSIYAIAIYFCYRQESRLLPECESSIRRGSSTVCTARIAIVILFGVILIGITRAIPPKTDSLHIEQYLVPEPLVWRN